jgi:hypothetical protein
MKHQWHKLLVPVGAGLGLIIATAASAEVTFNGFGQVVVGSTLNNDRPMDNRTHVNDYKADPTFQSESLFALQVQAPLAEKLSATAQIVADGAATGQDASGNFTHNDFSPKFAWAYATYQLSDNWSIKGGRQRTPLYHYSDYIQVGEAYPWIRPPLSVYASPSNNFDGLSLNGNFSAGDWYIQSEAFYGSYDGTVVNSGQATGLKVRHSTGVAIDATYDEWLEMRASYAYAHVTPNIAQVGQLQSALEGYAQILDQALGTNPLINPGSPAYLAAANELTVSDRSVSYISAGLSINKNNFILDGEYVWQKTPSWLPQSRAYYASLGYHFGRLTPVIVYGRASGRIGDTATGQRISSDVATGDAVLQLVEPSLPPPYNALPLLGSGVGTFVNAVNTVDDYYEFGLRYDLTRNTALKLDYTYYASPLDPTTNPGQGAQHAQLVSAGFVFTF